MRGTERERESERERERERERDRQRERKQVQQTVYSLMFFVSFSSFSFQLMTFLSYCLSYSYPFFSFYTSVYCLCAVPATLTLYVMVYREELKLNHVNNYGRTSGSSVSRARDFWSADRGFDPGSGLPLPTGWVGVSIIRPAETEVMVSPLCLCVAARKVVRRQSWDPSAK